jgi:hypothetical protein
MIMKGHDATEQAYKNGYEQGKKDAVKWIPVTERLPEDDLPKETKRVQIRCFVFTDKGSVKTCVRERGRTKRNGVWGYTAWWWSKTDFAKPTHWMPLPEPPNT